MKFRRQTRSFSGEETAQDMFSCKAPFTSMRLGPGGIIQLCCHNHLDIAGRYPETGLKEVWQGSAMQALRQEFARGRFARGCELCVSSSGVPGQNNGNIAFFDAYNADDHWPVMLDLKADDHCNLACIMCSGLSSHRIMKQRSHNIYDNPRFTDELEEFMPRLQEMRFSGGEPFLSSLYFQIWERLIRINPDCKISIQTNGTVLDERIKSLLERGEFHLNISIDSFRPETYQSIRTGADFNRMMENLQWFRDYSSAHHRDLRITTCALQMNAEELPGMLEKWNLLGVKGWISVAWFPPQLSLWTMAPETLDRLHPIFQGVELPSGEDIYQSNARAWRSFLDSFEAIREMSRLHYNTSRSEGVTADDFRHELMLMLGGKSVAGERVERILGLIPSGLRMNLKSFRLMASRASSMVLSDWLDGLPDERLHDIFNTFVIRKR